MRDGVLHHFPSVSERSQTHFNLNVIRVFHRSMQMEESGKNVRPLTILKQRQTLASEGFNYFGAPLGMVLVQERFLAESRQTGFRRGLQCFEMKLHRRRDN